MSTRARTTLLCTACLVAATAGCSGGFFGNSCGAASRVPLAPRGVYVDDDVADGFVKYAGALAAVGRWEGDATYGVHWCPAQPGAEGDGFRPYASRGHWTTSDSAAYGAAPGTPYWTSDDAAPWADITTHHGWWIDLRGTPSARSEWCWVPGLAETPARVVWREGGGFVGWAPEPPTWIDDGADDASTGFEWSYELLATLLEDTLDGYVLTGDAAQSGADATAPMGRFGEPAFSKRAPAKPVVDAARQQLVAYLRAHPDEVALASARTAAPAHPASGSSSGPAGASGAAGASGGSSSSPASKRKQDSDDASAGVVAVRIPSAGIIASMMMSDPVMVPVGLGRFTPPGSTVASGGYGSTGWSSGGGSSVESVHAAAHGGGSSSVHAPSHSSSSASSHGGGISVSSSSSHSGSSSSGSSHKR
jgi:hypothetical protein